MPKDTPDAPKMTTPPTGEPATMLTLAHAIAHVATWTDLPAARQRGITSALNLIARSAGLPPSAALLTVPFVQQHLIDRSPAALGLTKGTRANAVCDARLALCRLDLIDPEPDTIAPAWSALLARFDACEEPCRARAPYMRFAKFATLRGVDPDAVDDAVFAAFSTWVVTRALIARPTRIAGTFRRAWNVAAKTEPGWPSTVLALPPRSGDFSIPKDQLPLPFVQDMEDFLTRRATNDKAQVFSDEAPPSATDHPISGQGRGGARSNKPLRDSTITTRRDHIRWAAGALVASGGLRVEDLVSLATLVTPTNHAWQILRYFWTRAGNKPSTSGQHVGEVLSMIAELHVGLPKADLDQIKAWRAPMVVLYKGMTEKNDKLIRALLEPSRYKTLMRLPATVMEAAQERLADDPRFAASLAKRALAVQILLNLPPLRLANLIGLRLDRHLLRNDPKGRLVTHLWVPEDETKNSRLVSVPIGLTLATMIETWVTRFRPHETAPGNLFLFPGLEKRSITAQGMRDAVKAITHELVGVEVSPHKFRHLNAIAFLKEYPGQYEMVRQMLNHATVETTVRAYCGVERDDTHALFDRFNEERQGNAAPSRKKAPPGGKPSSHNPPARTPPPGKPKAGR